ncbi:hypothetical protein QVD17_03830 [Tagetes erecta]|uniref:Uncharacterized protein n=1 Tax=Tagetes erecta TaxID=13708 RepID=A0AAD8L908_TARER|nr:hypothetical protein QVD17_03830 [Tagetes erecta]
MLMATKTMLESHTSSSIVRIDHQLQLMHIRLLECGDLIWKYGLNWKLLLWLKWSLSSGMQGETASRATSSSSSSTSESSPVNPPVFSGQTLIVLCRCM